MPAVPAPLSVTPRLVTPTKKPVRKVVASGVGGVSAASVSIVIMWLLSRFAHIDPPPYVSAATASLLTAVIGFISGYLTPPSANDIPVAV